MEALRAKSMKLKGKNPLTHTPTVLYSYRGRALHLLFQTVDSWVSRLPVWDGAGHTPNRIENNVAMSIRNREDNA